MTPRRAAALRLVQTAPVAHDILLGLAQLLEDRNETDRKIAAIIGRPMTSGHLGEWIAAHVFDIKLEPSAAAAAIDGRFNSGPLQGRTVNVKWYLKREGILDMTASELLDDYLVMTGPVGAPEGSYGGTRPWRIDHAYLFDAHSLREDLLERGLHIGTAFSVRSELWAKAEIYPNKTNERLHSTERQAEALALFGAGA